LSKHQLASFFLKLLWYYILRNREDFVQLRQYSKTRLTELKQPFKGLVEQMIELAHAVNLDVQISCGYRSALEQKDLYAKGRTTKGPIVTNAAPGQSLHQYRIAVDLFFLDGDKADFSEGNYKKLWDECVKAGLDKQDLVWSGNWRGKLRESAHFQLGNPRWQDLMAKEKK
jgi:peptidoglycan L-alanyl-D-glutamate endopeptidase CwlK